MSMDTKKMMSIIASEIITSNLKFAEMEMRRKSSRGRGMYCHSLW